jgi:3',5'-nucleoside bisphosphate phosphatase
MILKADLHIHSCLSPCGSLEMSPARIIGEAEKHKLDMIALTDHNCARNLRSFESASISSSITPIFGLEVTTREEAHILALFPSVIAAEALGAVIESLLPPVPNNPDLFGDQVYVDEKECILGEVEVSLLQGADIGLEELCREVIERGGLFIPAHIDRPSFSIISQLGFLPDLPYSALEVTSFPAPVESGDFTLISNSDAHCPQDIGRRFFSFRADSPTFEGLQDALLHKDLIQPEHS